MNKCFSKAGLLLLLLSSSAFPQKPEKLSLNDAISLALQINPDVTKALREIEAANGRIKQAGRIPNPEFEISWDETPRSFSLSDADEVDIGVVQQIEFPTKRSNRIDIAAYDKALAELSLQRTKAIVTSQVKVAYYDALLSHRLLQSLEEQQQLLHDFQSAISARYQAGESNYLDVIRAKVEITRLGNEIVASRRETQQALRQLKTSIGKDPNDLLVLVDSLSYTPLRMQKDSLIESLLRKSASLEMANKTVDRQQSFRALAGSSYFPDISLGIFHQQRAEEPPFNANQFTGTTSKAFGLKLGISVPLWFWQEPKGQVEEANALIEIATINTNAIKRRIRTRVLNAYDLVLVADAQLKAFDETLLDDVQDIVATAIDQYKNNQIDPFNLFDVYRTFRVTKVEYARALYNYSLALAQLQVAAELPPDE